MRQLPEWIGSTDDTKPPKRVEVRVYTKFHGRCPICTRRLYQGQWDVDHIKALANGGENRESNLQPVCRFPCHRDKTRADVADKARAYEVFSRHVGAQKPRRTIVEWRKFNGDKVRAPRERS